MSFLAPGAFLLGLLLPVIVAMYLLKLRRVEREVPSTYLWRKMVRDVEANAPWQKLRPNLLMILQLLFLAVLILALARPFRWVEGAGGDAAIFIFDTSASMNAVDVEPSRIESAKERAHQLVDDLPGTARVTIIEAGREARVLLSSSLDRRQAHLVISEIRAGTGGSDMNVSLELASAIASRQTGAEIIVLSDGRVTLPNRLTVRGAVRYIPFGLNGENQAVSLLTLETAPGGASQTAFIQVTNYGDRPATRRLSLYADGLLVSAYDLENIPPGGQRAVIVEGLSPEVRQVEARLDGEGDILPDDDRAYAVRPDTRPVPVTLVTRGNLFIKTALSLLPGVVLTEQDAGRPPAAEETPPGEGQPTPTAAPTPTATAAPTANQEPPALTIYDNVLPDVIPPGGSLLFIAPPGSTDFFTVSGLVEAPQPRVIDPNDPLVANLTLDQVSILDAVRIPLPDWATPVAAGDLDGENIPLLFRGEVQGRRIAVLAFDVRHSDLPLQVAFPLLWANLVDWLAPGARSPIPSLVGPGETLTFNAPDGAETAVITRPDGSNVQIQAENGRFVFTDTRRLGVYQVTFPNAGDNPSAAPAAFAVNLFSPEESSLDPAGNLPAFQGGQGQPGAAAQRSQREWWRPLALLALGLLAGEWLVYQRASLARLRDMLRSPGAWLPRLRKGRS